MQRPSGFVTQVCAIALGLFLLAPRAVAQRSPDPLQFRPLELLNSVQPEYTPEARLARLQGSVVLYLEVSPAGAVDKASVIQAWALVGMPGAPWKVTAPL